MTVRLDTATHLIQGKEILSWTNTTEWAADELWFHLYWNAFQNNMSTFLRESGDWVEDVSGFGQDDWGYCRIESIRTLENPFFDEFQKSGFLKREGGTVISTTPRANIMLILGLMMSGSPFPPRTSSGQRGNTEKKRKTVMGRPPIATINTVYMIFPGQPARVFSSTRRPLPFLQEKKL